MVYKKTTTLGNLLSKRRPKASKLDTSHVCYAVPCMDCDKRYIGHTKRKLRIRLNEHKKSCEGDLASISPNPNHDNGIPYHQAQTGHVFDFDNAVILEHEKNFFRRLALEGIHIQIAKSTDLSTNINWFEIGQLLDAIYSRPLHSDSFAISNLMIPVAPPSLASRQF